MNNLRNQDSRKQESGKQLSGKQTTDGLGRVGIPRRYAHLHEAVVRELVDKVADAAVGDVVRDGVAALDGDDCLGGEAEAETAARPEVKRQQESKSLPPPRRPEVKRQPSEGQQVGMFFQACLE